MSRRQGAVWVAACAAALLTGCVRRSLTIRSDPPGAQILLNDQPFGVTPITSDLEWYGWYRLTLTKPGYERIDDEVEIRAPMHLWIPLDLAMELLPLQVKDPNVLAYRLIPAKEPEDPIPAGFREQYGIDSAQLEREAAGAAPAPSTTNRDGQAAPAPAQPSEPGGERP